MKVLITTSGVGSRLGELTQYTNKALVRIGKKPAISYILDNYPDDTEFVITTGYFGEHVKEFLGLAYPNHNFTFVDVNPYQGEGSSLGYSMLCAKRYLQCPFIFNACDTIIDEKITEITENWLGGSKKGASAQYRTFSTLNHKVSNMHEKGERSYDFEYLGICAIKDWELLWEKLDEVYQQNPLNSALSDCDALKQQIQLVEFSYRVFGWLDIGNHDSLDEARQKIPDKFEVLDKNDESIFLFDDFVVKFFSNAKVCKNRVQRAGILEGMVPKVTAHTEHFYKYEFADGYLLADVVNKHTILNLLEYTLSNLWISKGEASDEFYQVCKGFYFDKTIERIDKFHKQNNMKDEEHTINGVHVPTIEVMLARLDEQYLCNAVPTGFHGDFILDNMIINHGNITFIDWRQDFGGKIDIGDKYYDLGKLNHNLIINHAIVHDNGFFVRTNTHNDFSIDILRRNNLVECQEALHNKIQTLGLDLKRVKILSALIWLNMSPLHEKALGLFLYLFGKYMLFKELYES